MKIYLVTGSNWGEWDGTWNWNVKAFQDKTTAELFAIDLNRWVAANRPNKLLYQRWPDNPLDSNMSTDYYNLEYEVEEIEYIE